MIYKYGDSWEKYRIKEGETWVDKQTGSAVTVCNLIKEMPRYMLEADMIYSDPPWSLGNVNCFVSKAGKDDYLQAFPEFSEAFFSRIAEIFPSVCYVEIGKQNLSLFKESLSKLFPVVQEWEIKYYNKHLCYLLRGGATKQEFDFSGLDDAATPEAAIRIETPICVADLCTGRGLTAVAAYKLGKRFVGTELNKRRLAVAIERVNKLGGGYESTVLKKYIRSKNR